MPRLHRQLSLVVLFALLLTALHAARPVYAQSIVVNTLSDVDDGAADCGPNNCSLRKAIRLANSRAGANTITFSVAGEIVPLSPLPELADDGTTIDGGAGRTVVINGSSAGEANGITIRSSNNVIRGLVIYNFASLDEISGGAGIYINGSPSGGDNNQIYGNWIGLSGSGSAANSNTGYGIYITNGASNNIIGADNDNDRNVISGNRSGGVRLFNNVVTAGLLSGNRIVGNYIGIAPAGNVLPPGLDVEGADSGIGVSRGSRNTVISNNVIGGFNSSVTGAIAAGINVTGSGTALPLDGQEPSGTTITGNAIGVSRTGVRLPNRIGINLGGGEYGPFDTTIGGPGAADRNVIAGNGFRGINLPDTGFAWGDATIAGNYVGLDGSGSRQPNGWSSEAGGGPGIFIGRVRPGQPLAAGTITVGPDNVISANATYGIWVRSGGHTIRGNLFGTDVQGGTSSLSTTANGAANIFLENGTGVTVGGPTQADRNVIAFSDSQAGGFGGGIMIDPAAAAANNCEGACVSGGHTIEGNYIGVAANGSAALNGTRAQVLSKEGIRLRRTDGNVIRNNVIGGLSTGISVGTTTAGTGATGTLIVDNRIGAPAAGELFFPSYPPDNQISAPRNLADGIRIFRGSNNTIRDNLVAYNVSEGSFGAVSGGIRVGDSAIGGGASNNLVEANRLVRNGGISAWGVVVDNSTGVRLTRNTTQFNAGNSFTTFRGGILLNSGGNNGRPAPTGLAIQPGSPPRLTGTASGCSASSCTIEIFGSSLASEVDEGPVYLASDSFTGNFDVPLPACLRYLTATVTDAAGNTSPFSAQLDTGNPGPCNPLSFSLGAATNPSRSVAPGATTIYTHTISNSSPVELTFSVVVTSTQDWAAAPALVTVGANSTADFGVSVRVPPGTSTTPPAPVDQSDVQVFVGTQGSNVVRDTTTAEAATVIPATPAVSGPLTAQRTGPTVTFNHTVTNTGDLAGTFLIDSASLTGAPGDWSIGSIVPSSLTLGPQAFDNLAIVVNTPSLPPPTAPVTLTFRVSVQGSSPLRFVTQNDFITIPVARSFEFVPRSTETITTPAGASVSFTYTLTNTGNAADSFSVAVSPPTPAVAPPITSAVASTPSLSDLAPGVSAAVTVTYSVPPGTTAQAYASTITAQASGGTDLPAPQEREVTINVTGGAAVTIIPGPPSVDPVSPGPGGAVVSFTNTLSNSGNLSATVAIGPVTGVPAGWSASVTDTTCPEAPAELGDGDTCTFVVTVNVPPGAPGGPVPLGISATAFNEPPTPDVTATAVNTVNVLVVRGLELAPTGQTAIGGPGQVVTFTHTLTNTGNAPDSFALEVDQSDGRWTVDVGPPLVSSLPPGLSATVEVTAVAGLGITGGTTNTLTLTATGVDDGPSASVTDTVTLESIVAGELFGGGRRNVDPGGTVPYTFTVRNSGTAAISYTVELSNSLAAEGWGATAVDVPTLVLAPGLTTTVTVEVTAPLTAAPGVTNTTTVLLLPGDGAGAPLDSATAVTGIGPRLGVLITPKELTGEGRPNTTVVLTHTLTNLGSEQGTFQITTTESLGWNVEVSPDLVTLGPGDSIPLLVRVTIKPSAEAGARNFVEVRAELVGEPTVFDETIDEVTVPLLLGLNLTASQLRGVPRGATTSLDSLTVYNSGTAPDIYRLSVTGEDANWDVTLGRTIVSVNTGDPARISVLVRVGAEVAPGTERTLTIEARSLTDGTVAASVDLVLTALGPPASRIKTYLPQVWR